jgi:integrase/recombinase XerD
MKLDTAAADYLAALGAERGLAVNTVAAYRRDLRQYVGFLTAEGITDTGRVTPASVGRYTVGLHERGLASSTISRKTAATRGFHRFLVAEEISDVDPSAGLETPRRGSGLPKALTIDETTRLVEAPDTTTPLGIRDRALLEFMYASGSRVSEAVALEVMDVDLERGVALVRGKGDKQRYVPLGRYAVEAIAEYLPIRLELKGDHPDPGRLFLNFRGRPLTRQAVWLIVRKHAEGAGIAVSEVSPHVLRHSAATHMVEGGADLRSVQEILGHASINTTQIYTRVSPRHLLEVYVVAHPRSR